MPTSLRRILSLTWQVLRRVPDGIRAFFEIAVELALLGAPHASVDRRARVLTLERRRTTRRAAVVRIALEEIEVVDVRRRALCVFTVRVIDSLGAVHAAGLRFGRARAERIAQAIEEAAGLDVIHVA